MPVDICDGNTIPNHFKMTNAQKAGIRYPDGQRMEPGDVCLVNGDPDRDPVTVRGVEPDSGRALCEWRGGAMRLPATALTLLSKTRKPMR